jgi:hypothetical protein
MVAHHIDILQHYNDAYALVGTGAGRSSDDLWLTRSTSTGERKHYEHMQTWLPSQNPPL